jgi:hypothetical protein
MVVVVVLGLLFFVVDVLLVAVLLGVEVVVGTASGSGFSVFSLAAGVVLG